MQLYWRQNTLYFSVYSKENQTIKYVNKESCHRQSVFKAVPAGVFTRLGRLTSLTKDNQATPILDLYPLHHEALKKAKLLPKNVPTLQELHQQEDDRRRRSKKKEEETTVFRLSSVQLWKVHLEFLKSLSLRFSGCVRRTGNPLTRGNKPMMPPVCWSWKPSQRRRLALSASSPSASCHQHIRLKQRAHYIAW